MMETLAVNRFASEEFEKSRFPVSEEFEKSRLSVSEEVQKSRLSVSEELEKSRLSVSEELEKSRLSASEEFEKSRFPASEEFGKETVAAAELDRNLVTSGSGFFGNVSCSVLSEMEEMNVGGFCLQPEETDPNDGFVASVLDLVSWDLNELNGLPSEGTESDVLFGGPVTESTEISGVTKDCATSLPRPLFLDNVVDKTLSERKREFLEWQNAQDLRARVRRSELDQPYLCAGRTPARRLPILVPKNKVSSANVQDGSFRVVVDVSKFYLGNVQVHVLDDKINFFAKQVEETANGSARYEVHEMYNIPTAVQKDKLRVHFLTDSESLCICAPIKACQPES